MRYRNLFTGDSVMTEQNTLRYYIRRAKSALNKEDWGTLNKLSHDASACLDISPCDYCKAEDLGYCGLRNSMVSDIEKDKICLKSWVEALEKEYARLRKESCKKGQGM